jgi:mannose-1-phosphate guanylyltransferase
MFQHAVDRLHPLFSPDRVWVVTRREQFEILREQVPEIPADHYILEPEGRGTAPAIGLAATHLYRKDPEAVMAVLTADHYIQDQERFQSVLTAAEILARQGFLVTLGIDPNSASTAYGYIEQGQNLDPVDGFRVFKVRQFTEKPNRETAARMVSSGLYSWNSGMFIWQVKRILEELHRQMPEFYEQLMQIDDAMDGKDFRPTLEKIWPQVAKQTIDYGVMEGARDSVVIPVQMGWTDVGSWGNIADLLEPDEAGNVVSGTHIGIDTLSTTVVGQKRMIATIGIKDLVIIDSEDALLICARGQEQRVKEIVERLEQDGRHDLL